MTSLTSDAKYADFKLVAAVKEFAPTKQCKDDECLGVGDFARKYFPNGDVYVNENGALWEVLGNRKFSSQKLSTYNPIKIFKGIKEMGKRQKEKGIEGNFAGEGNIQGGVLILNPSGQVAYVYKEKTGYLVPKEEILSAMDRVLEEK